MSIGTPRVQRDNEIYLPLFVLAEDLPVLSLSYHLLVSFAFFHFCLFDVEVDLFFVVSDHLKCLWTKFMFNDDLVLIAPNVSFKPFVT